MNNKLKFYKFNQDTFLRYFDSLEQYNALIKAGNVKKIEETITMCYREEGKDNEYHFNQIKQKLTK